MSNIDLNYTSTVNGQTVHGAVIVPGPGTLGFRSIRALRNRSLPRRSSLPSPLATRRRCDIRKRRTSRRALDSHGALFGNDKTVLRGGYGKYIEALMSTAALSAWATQSSDVGFFNNSIRQQRRSDLPVALLLALQHRATRIAKPTSRSPLCTTRTPTFRNGISRLRGIWERISVCACPMTETTPRILEPG